MQAGRAGTPTRLLANFDPSATPPLMVAPMRALGHGQVFEQFVASNTAFLDTIAALDEARLVGAGGIAARPRPDPSARAARALGQLGARTRHCPSSGNPDPNDEPDEVRIVSAATRPHSSPALVDQRREPDDGSLRGRGDGDPTWRSCSTVTDSVCVIDGAAPTRRAVPAWRCGRVGRSPELAHGAARARRRRPGACSSAAWPRRSTPTPRRPRRPGVLGPAGGEVVDRTQPSGGLRMKFSARRGGAVAGALDNRGGRRTGEPVRSEPDGAPQFGRPCVLHPAAGQLRRPADDRTVARSAAALRRPHAAARQRHRRRHRPALPPGELQARRCNARRADRAPGNDNRLRLVRRAPHHR